MMKKEHRLLRLRRCRLVAAVVAATSGQALRQVVLIIFCFLYGGRPNGPAAYAQALLR
jgi:hypothetical protein